MMDNQNNQQNKNQNNFNLYPLQTLLEKEKIKKLEAHILEIIKKELN
jgi:hypothetical protein